MFALTCSLVEEQSPMLGGRWTTRCHSVSSCGLNLQKIQELMTSRSSALHGASLQFVWCFFYLRFKVQWFLFPLTRQATPNMFILPAGTDLSMQLVGKMGHPVSVCTCA